MTAWISLTVTGEALASEPFGAWSHGMGTAAQSLAAGESGPALEAARAAAAALTVGEAGARARTLAARALEQERRFSEAAEELRLALPALPAPLRPAVEARRAADLERAGHPAEAAQSFARAASMDRASPILDPARLAAREASAWLAAGEPREAARAASPAAADGDVPARLALARAWRALGDPRAPAALRALALERPGEPEGESAAALLARTAPSTLSTADQLARIRELVATGRSELALAELDRLDPAVSGSPLGSVLRAMTLLRAGRNDEAERFAAPVARLPGPGEPAAARYVLARVAARQGRTDEAVARYREVLRERPVVPGLSPQQQGSLQDDAAYLVAWLPYEAGRLDAASEGLRRYLREHPGSRRAPDARWFLAWIQVRSGDREGARRALADVASRETGALRAAALYWQARLEPDPGRTEARYREAAAEVPGGYYALLSGAWLSRLGAPPLADEPTPPPSPPPEPPSDPQVGRALLLAADLASLGLREESSAVLQRVARGKDARARAPLVAETAAFCGDPELPHRLSRDALPAGLRTRRWSHPDAYAPLLRPAARHLGIDPDLVLAVMRRESAFQPAVRSLAGAEGLVQLRPVTAERLGSVLGPLPGPVDLSDPAANVPTGIAYLALLVDRFGSPAPAIAAYNAGPAAAERWARSGAGRPLDEWVEDIPYRETRQYVRGVIADWARYRRLDGEPPPVVEPWSLVTPPGPGVAF